MSDRRKHSTEAQEHPKPASSSALVQKPIASPLAVMTPPEDALERRVFGATVTAELESLFRRRLSAREVALCDSGEAWTLKMLCLLDKMIVELAQTFGWRIYESELVRKQMARWHNTRDKLHLIKQLGDAVYLAASVAHGRGKLPVRDPELKVLKPQAVGELRRLLKQSRNHFNQYRTLPSGQEVCKLFRRTVESSQDAYPFWSRNIDSLLQYFERADTLVRRIALGDVRPGALFDEWGADIHNLKSPEIFRQSVSNLPASKL